MVKDVKKLDELGIKDNGKKRQTCPNCRDTRSNKTDKSLSINWKLCTAYCYHCDKKFFFGKTDKSDKEETATRKKEETKEYKKPGRLANEEAPGEEVLKWFESRGIPADVVVEEGITQAARVFSQKGVVEKCMLFPYYEEDRLVNRKYRTVKAKHFMLEAGAKLIPWRINEIEDTPECIITEGEMDALSFIVAGRDDVISVPNGAQKNLGWLEDFIETHMENKQRIYIAADTDKKGLELRAELVRRFGEEKCRIVTYGEGCKDANELLMQSGAEALRQAISEAQEVPIEGVFTAGDVRDELKGIFEHGLQKGAVFGMGDLDNLLSVEVGRLMIVTGIPGHGKSEMLDEMALHLSLNYDWRCAYFSPENFPVTLHYPKLIEKLIGKKFKKGLMSEMDFNAAVDYLSNNFFDILPEEGYRVDTILERAEALVRRKGIRVFILDPYNCLEHLIPQGQSETQYISEFLEKLRSFAHRRQVLVILAAHPIKMKKDPSSGKYPVPTMYDISGSAAFYNKADFGIAIERDRERDITRVHVHKVKFRHLGDLGVASFRFSEVTSRYNHLVEGKTPDLPDEVKKWDNSNWLAKKLEEKTVQAKLALD